MPVLTEELTGQEHAVPEVATLYPLKPDTSELCDGEASGSTLALFRVALPGGKDLALCGHHSRHFGYNPKTHKTHLTAENRGQGSSE